MAEINDLNVADASNTERFPEGQTPSSVNDGLRALEGLLARGFKDAVEGNKNSSGGNGAYEVELNRTISAYYDGLKIGFHANHPNTGAASINVDGLGAKDLKKHHALDLRAGDIEEHQYVEAVYSASDDTFQMLTPTAQAEIHTIGIAVSDEGTALLPGARRATFRMPYAFRLSGVRASLSLTPGGAGVVVDINSGGTSILSTKLTVDEGDKTSQTSDTPAVISTETLLDDAEITIDIDQVGSDIAGAGLKVYMIGRRV